MDISTQMPNKHKPSQTQESFSPNHGPWPPLLPNLLGDLTMASFAQVGNMGLIPTPSPSHQCNHQVILVFSLKLFQDLASPSMHTDTVGPKFDSTWMPPEEVTKNSDSQAQTPGPAGTCILTEHPWSSRAVGSEKHRAGNLGERLGVPDHLPLLLFHPRYTVSPMIGILSNTTLASTNPTIASMVRDHNLELFLPSEPLRPALVVVVAGPQVVVLLPEKYANSSLKGWRYLGEAVTSCSLVWGKGGVGSRSLKLSHRELSNKRWQWKLWILFTSLKSWLYHWSVLWPQNLILPPTHRWTKSQDKKLFIVVKDT